MINRYKIHRIVEYIKQSDFEFETFDVLEEIDTVLAYYDLLDIELNEEETALLVSELLPLAEEFEFREVSFLVSQDDLLLLDIHEHIINPKIQAIERRIRGVDSNHVINESAHNLAVV